MFLDEIGDLPVPAQAALLRVLQEGEVMPVGATKSIKVDLRVVAATHRDLEEMAEREDFRSDLLARISGFTLRLPPLRERLEDLGLLTAALLERHLGPGARYVRLTCAAAQALFSHTWPLNVRELEKNLTAAAVLAGDGPIGCQHLELAKVSRAPTAAEARIFSDEEVRRREAIVSALRDHHGNITAAARALGKARPQLQRWIKRYQIDLNALRR